MASVVTSSEMGATIEILDFVAFMSSGTVRMVPIPLLKKGSSGGIYMRRN